MDDSNNYFYIIHTKVIVRDLHTFYPGEAYCTRLSLEVMMIHLIQLLEHYKEIVFIPSQFIDRIVDPP